MPGTVSATSPGVTFAAPYTAFTTTAGNSSYDSPCNSGVSVPAPAAFNATTGRISLKLVATAGHGPACPTGMRGRATSALASEFLYLDSPTFTPPTSGIKVLRPYFQLDWTLRLSANVGPHNQSTYAAGEFEINVFLADTKSSSFWQLSSPYYNNTVLTGINSSLVRVQSETLQLPLMVVATHGDPYFFELQFNFWASASQGGAGASARAVLSMGIIGPGFDLAKVTFH
ncbi:MAG: hypothetical protein L3K18_02405 [Thermoplasmata archaeon]|nr:hypothetical protein [Thermoplasmata archaeon]